MSVCCVCISQAMTRLPACQSFDVLVSSTVFYCAHTRIIEGKRNRKRVHPYTYVLANYPEICMHVLEHWLELLESVLDIKFLVISIINVRSAKLYCKSESVNQSMTSQCVLQILSNPAKLCCLSCKSIN